MRNSKLAEAVVRKAYGDPEVPFEYSADKVAILPWIGRLFQTGATATKATGYVPWKWRYLPGFFFGMGQLPGQESSKLRRFGQGTLNIAGLTVPWSIGHRVTDRMVGRVLFGETHVPGSVAHKINEIATINPQAAENLYWGVLKGVDPKEYAKQMGKARDYWDYQQSVQSAAEAQKLRLAEFMRNAGFKIPGELPMKPGYRYIVVNPNHQAARTGSRWTTPSLTGGTRRLNLYQPAPSSSAPANAPRRLRPNVEYDPATNRAIWRPPTVI